MRALITRFLRFALKRFYRRIEVVGREQIPGQGAVMFAVNHPNGLVDPLFVLSFAPRPVSFLAKAPILRYPLIGWFARALDTIPVYRKQDETKGSNAETFGKARAVLQQGGGIAIFPEGTTHDDPRLRELKSGAARIALGASLPDLAIVPAGIYYTAKSVFRSSALVVFGAPLHVAGIAPDAGGEPPPDAVRDLTMRIDAALDGVTLQAESHPALDLAARAERIFSANEEQPLGEEFDLRRNFVDGYRYLCERDAPRLRRLENAIAQFEADLRRAKVEVHDLSTRVKPVHAVRPLLLLPFGVAGAILHYPLYRLIGLMARHFSKGESATVATMKFIGALTLYPLMYLVAALAVGFAVHAWLGALVAVLLPLLGWAAIRLFEDLEDLAGDLRAWVHSRMRQPMHQRLIEERRAIRAEFISIAQEMQTR